MTCRIYFRGRLRKNYALIDNCPDEETGIRTALKIWGNTVDLCQNDEREFRDMEVLTLLERVNFDEL